MTDTTKQIEQERAAFEAWAQKNFMDLERADFGKLHYISHDTRNAWLAWQESAARATPSPVPAEPRHVRDQAEAWLTVCALLSELEPGWAGRIGTGLESALATIRNLASRPAPVADKDAMTRLRRVLGLLDITDPFPTDDDKLHVVLFSLLGQIARKIENRAAPVAEHSTICAICGENLDAAGVGAPSEAFAAPMAVVPEGEPVSKAELWDAIHQYVSDYGDEFREPPTTGAAKRTNKSRDELAETIDRMFAQQPDQSAQDDHTAAKASQPVFTHISRRWCQGDAMWSNWMRITAEEYEQRKGDESFQFEAIENVTYDAAAPSAAQAAGVEKLFSAIIDLPCHPVCNAPHNEQAAYRKGHRDARIAAAELVAAHFATTPSEGVAAPVEPVLTVEVEPDYWSGGHFHQGHKPWVNPSKVQALQVGTKLYTSAPAQPSADQVASEAAVRDAARDVLAERRRQIEAEGWTPEHDDMHCDGQMAQAAACYALHTEPVGNVGDYLRYWPWAPSWWKPRDKRSNLVRAGALILAEIERLDRAAAPAAVPQGRQQIEAQQRERLEARFAARKPTPASADSDLPAPNDAVPQGVEQSQQAGKEGA